MAGFLILLQLAFILLVAHPDNCHAGELSASRERMPEGSRRGNATEKERSREREKRFIIRTLDDLKGSLSLAEEEIRALEKEIDAITLLESPQREKDFSNLLDWYHDYDDWLARSTGDFEDDLALVSAGPAQGDGRWEERYDVLVNEQDALAGELEKRVKRYDAEEKRLAGIIERRRELQDLFGNLEHRARIEERPGDSPESAPERRERERKAEKLRTEIRVVQNELLSLPLVDEDLLKHYAVLVEKGHGELDWLSLKRDEYDAARDLAAVTGRVPRRDAAAIEAAYQQAARVFESEINRLSRKMDELDRKRSRVTPAGSLKEVERSRELGNFYERLQGRYDSEIRRLRVLIGACNAELAEVLSEK
ncbi:MAG TPA: hypothetical protein VI298_13225 [Geobacteraceae bacterium]